jgi:hypothetical protein
MRGWGIRSFLSRGESVVWPAVVLHFIGMLSCSNRAPDTARIKLKMLYESFRQAFRGSLDGIAFEVGGSDREVDELSHSASEWIHVYPLSIWS